MTKPAELRQVPDDDLWHRLEEAKEELFNLRFQLATGQLDNPVRIKEVRRDVARILTLLRERELEIADHAERQEPTPAPDEASADEEKEAE